MSKKLLLVFSLLFFLPLLILAANGGVQLQPPISATSIYEVIQLIIGWLTKISIPIVVIIAIWAGITFATSMGQPEKVKKAREILLYTAIGFAVILVSNGVVYWIGDILGFDVMGYLSIQGLPKAELPPPEAPPPDGVTDYAEPFPDELLPPPPLTVTE